MEVSMAKSLIDMAKKYKPVLESLKNVDYSFRLLTSKSDSLLITSFAKKNVVKDYSRIHFKKNN